jgi:hypothetical protein
MPIVLNGDTGVTTPSVSSAGPVTASAIQTGGVATDLYALVSGTAASSVSVTSIPFTGIPSWVKRITVLFAGVSTNGTSNQLIQLGTGATPTYTVTGYLGSAATSSGGTLTNFSTGFMYNNSVAAASTIHGQVTLSNITGNVWVESGVLALSDSANTRDSGGSIALAAPLTAIRVITVNGTDTFDAGTINILYE